MLLNNNTASKSLHAKRLALIIQDDLVAEMVFMQMKKHGVHVDICYCLESYTKNVMRQINAYDVLVWDMDGFDCIEAEQYLLHSDQKPRHIIALSAHNDIQTRLKAVRMQAQSFFLKPTDIDALCAEIHQAMQTIERKVHSVMIVDDNISELKLYQYILEAQNIRVRLIHDPLETLKELQNHKPDLALIDYYMPSTTGLEVIHVIRQIYTADELAIMFITGSQDLELLTNLHTKSGCDIIDKSLGAQHFTKSVLNALHI